MELSPPEPESPPPPATPPMGDSNPLTVVVQPESMLRTLTRTGLQTLLVMALLMVLPFVATIWLIFAVAFAANSAGTDSEFASSDILTEFHAGDPDGETRLVILPVSGVILGANNETSNFFSIPGVVYGYTIKEQLISLAEDEQVDGVLLEMSTPGGTIFGSKAIADGIEQYKAITDKPLIAYVADISASGGMYAMAGADTIIADHGTLIGSIGVIFGPFQRFNNVTAIDGGLFFGGVTTEDGITVEHLTAGRNKDLGSPYRDMTAEERNVLQEGLDDAYDAFVAHVAKNRNLSDADVRNRMGAMIFGEEQARNRGLVDQIGSREDAYNLLADSAGADDANWRIDRTIDPADDFFSLFARGPEPAEQHPTNSLCTTGPVILAYHGDPSLLCR